MNPATLRYDRPPSEIPRLSTSIALSVAIHALVIVMAAAIWRALPPAARGTAQPVMEATLMALPSFKPDAPLPLDLLTNGEPIETMLPVPVTPPAQPASLPGISMIPANVPIDADFAPVGNISSGVTNGSRLFGDGLAEKMQSRYPMPVSQPPLLAGPMVAMYPVKGARKGQSIAMSALLMIDAGGRITEARVLPDDPVFVSAVMAALKNATFKPAKAAGRPVPYWMVIDFHFAIDGPTGPDGKRLDR